jgi:hypothetical protein
MDVTSPRKNRKELKWLSEMPADGMMAAAKNQDFGTSDWQLLQ